MTFDLHIHAYTWARSYGWTVGDTDIEDIANAYAAEYVRNFAHVPETEWPDHSRFFAFWLSMTTVA